MIFIGALLPDLGGGEGDQRHDPRLLDLHRQLPLVLRAVPGDAPRDDLAALGDELLDHVDVLVVDLELLLGAEAAELLPHVPLLPSGAAVVPRPFGAGLVRGAHRVLPPFIPCSVVFRTGCRRPESPAPGRRRATLRRTRRAVLPGTGRCRPRSRSCSASRRRTPSCAASGAPRRARAAPWRGTPRSSPPSCRTRRCRRRRPPP